MLVESRHWQRGRADHREGSQKKVSSLNRRRRIVVLGCAEGAAVACELSLHDEKEPAWNTRSVKKPQLNRRQVKDRGPGARDESEPCFVRP